MIDEIIMKLRRARSTMPIFSDRVTGVADIRHAVTYTGLAWPACYVTFLGEEAEAQQPGSNENNQRCAQHWGVIVGLDASPDIRGHDPIQRLERIRTALMLALYNWRPPGDGYEGAFWYNGCRRLEEINRAAAYFVFTFSIYARVCGEEGEGETEENFEQLPAFETMHAGIDFAQPHDRGLPPSQMYDPKYGPPPWAKGPEGRVEVAFRLVFPPPPPLKKET
jgi:hypothetical protein